MPASIPLHHCKFIDYTPASITAIAFPPLPLRSASSPSSASASTVNGQTASSEKDKAEMGWMAVGKGNGDVELFRWVQRGEGSQGWVYFKTLYSPNGTKIESLVFSLKQSFLASSRRIATLADVRLFSSGGSSDLIEWDLNLGCILKLFPTQSGSLWSISVNPSSTLLALGCEDGSLRLVSLSDDTDLVHHRKFERTKARLLSIAWGPPTPPFPSNQQKTSAESDEDDDEAEENVWEDSWIVTGCSDSCLRKWDVKTGRVVDRMTVEKEKVARGKGGRSAGKGVRSVVWCVGVLRDGTVVSGDSLGMVKFWDSNTATQISSFHAHGADVLTLAVSPDHKSIFTSGIDQKTVQFTQVSLTTATNSNSTSSHLTSKWIQSATRRFHTHDVLSLAIFPPASPVPASSSLSTSWPFTPVLVSGGVDTTLIATPCATPGSLAASLPNAFSPLRSEGDGAKEKSSNVLGEAYYRKNGAMNGVRGDTLSVCKGGRLISSRREKGVAIWRLGEVAPKGMRKQMEDEEMDDLVAAVGGVGGMDGVRGGWEKLLEMELKTGTNLLTSGLSEDGRWLAVSDLGETKLFRLRLDDPTRTPSAKRVRSLTPTLLAQCPPSLNLSRSGTGSSTLCFTPDSSKLILATALGGDVVVLDLSSLDSSEDGEGEAKVLRVFEQRLMGGGGKVDGRTVIGKKNEAAGTTAAEDEEDGAMDVDGEEESVPSSSSKDKIPFATVSCMSVGHDGQYLAISDLLGRTRIYNLDTLQLHSHLPTFPHHPPSALAFLPNPNSLTTSLLLIAVPSGNQLHVYDIDKRRFPPHLNTPVSAEVRSLTDPVLGIAADASTASGTGSVLMWAGTWVCRVRLGGGGANSRKAIKKRKMAGLAVEGGGAEQQSSGPKAMEMARFALSKDYRSLLGVQFVGEKELVLVERPWLDLVGTLPASYFKGGKYGT